jgi:YggT family protein
LTIVNEVVAAALGLFALAIFVMMLMSWFPMRPGGGASQVYRMLLRLTDPVIRPVRRSMPSMGPIDVAPLIVLLVVMMLRNLLLG